ncbi:hypothetical protein QJS04_geneDACA004707 [Acorus gramineus]|uniref:Uncharacterized protein n=1 Tax=Acorus gramineus TaxID=55184 RepID=A0AAV9BVW5_ACOGR|nr:hypothetical protein QJS04_geneDACA004707 [Acorus gramineus]
MKKKKGESNKNEKKRLFSKIKIFGSSKSEKERGGDPDIDEKAVKFIASKKLEWASKSSSIQVHEAEGDRVGDPDIDVQAAKFIAKKKEEWASSSSSTVAVGGRGSVNGEWRRHCSFREGWVPL